MVDRERRTSVRPRAEMRRRERNDLWQCQIFLLSPLVMEVERQRSRGIVMMIVMTMMMMIVKTVTMLGGRYDDSVARF